MSTEWDEQVSAYCAGLGPLEKDARDAIDSIGWRTLRKAVRACELATRVMGSDGKSDYALALCGSALSPITRRISKDSIAFCVLGFAFGSPVNVSFTETMIWAARWHEMGMPTVRVTTQQVAALALTDIDQAEASLLRAPWPAFAIALESDALPVVLSDSLPDEITGQADDLGVQIGVGECTAKRIAVIAYQGDAVLGGILSNGTRERASGFLQLRIDVDVSELWSGVVTISELCRNVSLPWSNGDKDRVKPDELEARAVAISKQLTVNVIQAIVSHGITKRKPVKGDPPQVKVGLRERKEYILGAPVRVNAIPALHQYLTGRTSRAYKVRWIVRGHWRNQPCGPGLVNLERKWIEPYWKGHADAPVNVREHVL